MKTLGSLVKTISDLQEQDRIVKAMFCKYVDAGDAKTAEVMHKRHHTIKRWIEQLSVVQSEMEAEEIFAISDKVIGSSPVFYIRRKDMASEARGEITETGFRVFRGSYILPDIVPYMYDVVKRLRAENVHNIDAMGILLVDLVFSNAGQAAIFVTGKSVNGLTDWRTDDNTPLRDILAGMNSNSQ